MNPSIHIGQLVKERIAEKGMSKAELARRLFMSPANIHKIFKRSSVDSHLLYKLGVILDYNFFKYYHKPVFQLQIAQEEFELRHFAELEIRIEKVERRLRELSERPTGMAGALSEI